MYKAEAGRETAQQLPQSKQCQAFRGYAGVSPLNGGVVYMHVLVTLSEQPARVLFEVWAVQSYLEQHIQPAPKNCEGPLWDTAIKFLGSHPTKQYMSRKKLRIQNSFSVRDKKLDGVPRTQTSHGYCTVLEATALIVREL